MRVRQGALCAVLGMLLGGAQGGGQTAMSQKTILYGAAYYEEYPPYDRLEEDVRMMKATGITVVRSAEFRCWR